MGKRRRVYLGVLAIGIVAVSAALLFRSSEPPQPYYQGRSLDWWLDEWTEAISEPLGSRAPQSVNSLNGLPPQFEEILTRTALGKKLKQGMQ